LLRGFKISNLCAAGHLKAGSESECGMHWQAAKEIKRRTFPVNLEKLGLSNKIIS
jgi:hypothetical protein